MKNVGEVLELYDGNKRLAFLLYANEVIVKETLNSEYYVQFVYPRLEGDSRRYGLLKEQLDIVFPDGVERGQRFTIRSVEEVRKGKKIYKVVEAHHVAFNLGGYFYDGFMDFAAGKSLVEMLTILGQDTPYSFVVEGNFPVQDIWDWGEKRKIDLLQELRELYNAELAFDNYTITLTARKGQNYGALIQYKHNMKGIKRKSHDMERVTRLYGYGKNGLTIEGYGGHTVKFIDSEYFDPMRPLMGKVEFPEIESQARLLQEMQKHLRKYELPNFSYDVEFVQLEKVDREHIDDKIHGTGDTVTVRDAELGYLFEARVNYFERYPFDKKSGRVTLSNFRELKTSDYIFQATVGSKKAMSFTNKNAVLKGVKYDDSITLVDGMGMLVSDDQGRPMVRLGQTGPGEYGQAMYNKAGARTIWQDAATGDARFSGRLIASVIEGGQIYGAVISGGEIYGAHIATRQSGYPRVILSESLNALTAEYSANRRISVDSNNYLSNLYPHLRFTTDGHTATIHHSGTAGWIFNSSRMIVSADLEAESLHVGSLSDITFGSGSDNLYEYLEDEYVSNYEYTPLITSILGRLQTLENEIAEKAISGINTKASPQYNGGIAIGTKLMVDGGGTVTWSGIPAHVHEQV